MADSVDFDATIQMISSISLYECASLLEGKTNFETRFISSMMTDLLGDKPLTGYFSAKKFCIRKRGGGGKQWAQVYLIGSFSETTGRTHIKCKFSMYPRLAIGGWKIKLGFAFLCLLFLPAILFVMHDMLIIQPAERKSGSERKFLIDFVRDTLKADIIEPAALQCLLPRGERTKRTKSF